MATRPSILACRIPMDRGAWQATVHVVAKSWTELSELAQNGDLGIENRLMDIVGEGEGGTNRKNDSC